MLMGFELILVAGVIAFAIGWRPNFIQNRGAASGQTPVEILKARYASGEITRDEYEQRRRDLEG